LVENSSGAMLRRASNLSKPTTANSAISRSHINFHEDQMADPDSPLPLDEKRAAKRLARIRSVVQATHSFQKARGGGRHAPSESETQDDEEHQSPRSKLAKSRRQGAHDEFMDSWLGNVFSQHEGKRQTLEHNKENKNLLHAQEAAGRQAIIHAEALARMTFIEEARDDRFWIERGEDSELEYQDVIGDIMPDDKELQDEITGLPHKQLRMVGLSVMFLLSCVLTYFVYLRTVEYTSHQLRRFFTVVGSVILVDAFILQVAVVTLAVFTFSPTLSEGLSIWRVHPIAIDPYLLMDLEQNDLDDGVALVQADGKYVDVDCDTK